MGTTVGAASAAGQEVGPGVARGPVEYRSATGVMFRAQADTGPVARAAAALAAAPRDVGRVLALGLAQAGARQYREAIATFTRGLALTGDRPAALAPDSAARARALLYRWRGHRLLSTGQFDRALEDLTRAARLDSTLYGAWYHLAIARYARGDFAGAADAMARAQPLAPDGGELAGATDWRWMALSRAGRAAEARAMLDRRPDSLPAANAYTRRLALYRGQLGPEAVLTAADTEPVAVSTLSYGVGTWYLVRGDTAAARTWFARSVAAGGWPAFGFLLSEVEQRRLRPAPVPRSARRRRPHEAAP
jgi:tetratricopeptide (TPR) repeat protein